MSIIERPSSTPAAQLPRLTEDPTADFERRWTAWKARGLVHERVVRRRFLVCAIAAAVMAVAVTAGALLAT